MECSYCSKKYLFGETWIKPHKPFKRSNMTIVTALTDMIDTIDISEKFCSKECMRNYIKAHGIEIDFNELKIDMVQFNMT